MLIAKFIRKFWRIIGSFWGHSWRLLCQYSLISVSIFFLIIACQNVSNSPNSNNTQKVSSTGTQAQANCVSDYNPNQDYFPYKISVKSAQGFTVEYKKNYKIVTVKEPWEKANQNFQYILVQCGTPAPQEFKPTQIINIPVNSVIALSNTHLPHLVSLNVVDKLVGVNDINRANTSQVQEKIKAGKIESVGNGSSLNIEKIIELNPDLVTTYGTGNPQTDSYPKLAEAGLKVAINAEYRENSPMGRSEWLKFTGLFFNREEQAEKVFSQINQNYQKMVTKAQAIKKRPQVFTGFNFKGTWYAPGCKSYVAQYLTDAGADLICIENSEGSTPIAFENMFARAANADYWFNGSQEWKSLADIIADDKRYGEFKAFKIGNVYNNNLRLNPGGGNDYWESGIINPDVVLADLIKILHPQVLPNHQLFYYRKLV